MLPFFLAAESRGDELITIESDLQSADNTTGVVTASGNVDSDAQCDHWSINQDNELHNDENDVSNQVVARPGAGG